MQIFVTGGTGLIGSRVVRRLVAGGHHINCLLRSTSNTSRIDDLSFTPIYGDMRDPASLKNGMANCDAVIHLASPSSWEEIAGDQVEPVIVDGTKSLVAAIAESSINRLVYVSSAAAVNGSEQPTVFDETAEFTLSNSGLRYAIAKHNAEKIVTESGIDAVIVCPGETYAPGDDEWITAGALRDALSGWPALALRGGASVTHADDVAAGIVAALAKGRTGERYILAGENLTVTEIVRTALRAANLRRPVLTLPRWLVAAVVRACVAIRVTPPLPADLVGYAARYWFTSSEKAIRELGYQYRPAEQTIRAVVEWMKERPAA